MRTTTETTEKSDGCYPAACPTWFGPLMFTAAIFIIITAIGMLAGCAAWSNASRPGATYETDHRECMNEIGLITVGKPYGERLNDCVAAKGWVRQ